MDYIPWITQEILSQKQQQVLLITSLLFLIRRPVTEKNGQSIILSTNMHLKHSFIPVLFFLQRLVSSVEGTYAGTLPQRGSAKRVCLISQTDKCAITSKARENSGASSERIWEQDGTWCQVGRCDGYFHHPDTAVVILKEKKPQLKKMFPLEGLVGKPMVHFLDCDGPAHYGQWWSCVL